MSIRRRIDIEILIVLTRIRRQIDNVESSSNPCSFDVESTSKSLSFRRGFDVKSITSNPHRILIESSSNPYRFDIEILIVSTRIRRQIDNVESSSNPHRILIGSTSNQHRNPYRFDEDSTSNR